MGVRTIETDLADHTMRIQAEYPAPSERLWNLWADPRQLEKWWGPPGYPATFTDHDLSVGGTVKYYMTGPEGEKYHGGWRVLAVDPPNRLEMEDFFADANGNENPDLPISRTVISIADAGDGLTRMSMVTGYPTPEALQKVLDMGMEEGIRMALEQIDTMLDD